MRAAAGVATDSAPVTSVQSLAPDFLYRRTCVNCPSPRRSCTRHANRFPALDQIHHRLVVHLPDGRGRDRPRGRQLRRQFGVGVHPRPDRPLRVRQVDLGSQRARARLQRPRRPDDLAGFFRSLAVCSVIRTSCPTATSPASASGTFTTTRTGSIRATLNNATLSFALTKSRGVHRPARDDPVERSLDLRVSRAVPSPGRPRPWRRPAGPSRRPRRLPPCPGRPRPSSPRLWPIATRAVASFRAASAALNWFCVSSRVWMSPTPPLSSLAIRSTSFCQRS